MTDFSTDCLVIGAGVVGLAIARRLALSGRETILIEAEGAIGTGTSSRNSEVVHAGLYYPTGSLKARACVAGREALYAYCAERGVEARRCGKLLVATTEDQRATLAAIAERALANGVADLVPLTAEMVRDIEPEVSCVEALLSPSTGIVDSHALMLALQGDVEAAGGGIAFHAPVAAWRVAGDGLIVETGGAEPATIGARAVVNAAGHGAPRLLAKLAGFPPALVPRQHYAKGNYFSLLGRQPFKRLVYPMPDGAGLGVHATVDLKGRVRFGPDVEWVEGELDYHVDPARGDAFTAAVRAYWPSLSDGALQPDYAGIRPKLHGPGEPVPDFHVEGPATHGVPGLVNLLGIESPGLTACLALADMVVERLEPA